MNAFEMFMGIIAAGAGLISYMLNRAVTRLDKTIDEHDSAISQLKTDVTKAQMSNDATVEMFRQLRHDLRDYKQSVNSMFQEVMKLLSKGER